MRRTLLINTLLLLASLSAAWAFDESDFKKLQTLNECNKCDLSRANLSYADLFKANLTGADLTGASMKGAILDEAVFCKTKTPWGEENSGCLIN